MERWLFNFGLALRGINANKLRSLLTALGIVFGVAAVIAMLSIGSGAKRAILDQMRLIGANNIVLEAIVPDPEKEASSGGSNANGNKWWLVQCNSSRFDDQQCRWNFESFNEYTGNVCSNVCSWNVPV